MATYAIGDVQGCFEALKQLLKKVNFEIGHDKVWFVGDVINRGPQSLETLRFIKALGDSQVTVLGNHDLTLLAIAYEAKVVKPTDTITDILNAPDGAELIEWLRHRPLLHYDAKLNFVMTHAGLAPAWTLEKAMQLAAEVETALRGPQCKTFLANMYGDQPANWQDDLTGMDRLRCITNYLTRMRFCYADGSLDLNYKGQLENKPPELFPWYALPKRCNQQDKIIFGHWAALNGQANTRNIFALDTGCVWGNCLTALRLEDEMRFSVTCGK